MATATMDKISIMRQALTAISNGHGCPMALAEDALVRAAAAPDRVVREVELPPVVRGHARAYRQCEDCGRVVYYDYVPYSTSVAIMVLPCGHAGEGKTITEQDALAALQSQQD